MTFDQWIDSLDDSQWDIARGKEGLLGDGLRMAWNAALEEAAKAAEQTIAYGEGAEIEAAKAIRALKEGK